MIAVQPCPDHARSDGAQSLTFREFAALTLRIASVAAAVGRRLAVGEVVTA